MPAELIALDLLPPRYHTVLCDAKIVIALLERLELIVEGIIESQIAYFKEKKQHLFDPHPEESCCEIRAVNLLLHETQAPKPDVDFNFQIRYLHRMKLAVNFKINYFLENEYEDVLTLKEFLRQHELILLMSLIDKYIFVSYFLTKYKTSNLNVRELTDYYKTIIPSLSRRTIVCTARNISERKKTEVVLQLARKQAEAANRAKTEFLENMRHDIRTPLTGIIGFARLIQAEAVSQRTKEYADNLVLATTALLDFQNEILDEMKVSRGVEPVLQESFHLKTLVEKILNLIRPKAIVKKLALSLIVDENLPGFVCGDSKRLFRILLELVTNALKFTAEGQIQIRLSIEKINEHRLILRCDVSDTGIGIPDDKKDAIFTRFHRLSPSSDGVYEGTGLGLTIVKKYIKDLGGRIILESTKNKGATFTCYIPFLMASQELILKSTKETEEKIIFDCCHVLLVEDHTMTATVTQLMLFELGCSVDIAFDAKTALLKSKNKKYDVVFMDLGLPDCNGFELAKKMVVQQGTIIALTAHREEDNTLRCKASGIDIILQKPLLKSTAIKILNNYFSGEKMKKPIIDLPLGARRINKDIVTAQSMIDLLLKGIDIDQKNIEQAYCQKDWGKLHDANHKLLGGLAYCGAPRLEAACIALQAALKKSVDVDYSFRAVLSEIKTLKN
ncbi:MAG: ATP-binding protein [Gammaproteobacteria bacterium]|nr:ATP-binding protein [Gammaproteobacteria bacterium]